jgi:uncharacterized protein (DUF2384 family)
MYEMPDRETNEIHNESELVDLIKSGFKASYARHFMRYTGLPLDIWAKILPVSKRTLQRELNREKHFFEASLAEPFIEVGEIYAIGMQAFDNNKDRLNEWLMTQNPYFEGKTPIEIMNTHKGRDLIKLELTRIEHSEFS